MTSRSRGLNPDGQTITVHEGDIVEIIAVRLAQRKLGQGYGGYTLSVTVNQRFIIDEWSAYRLSALKTTDTGADRTIPGLGFTEVTVAPTPDTTSSPVVRDNDYPGGPGWSFPSKYNIRSEGRISDDRRKARY